MKKMLILLVFIGYSVAGFGQQDSVFTIEGTVVDEVLNKPVRNVLITLRNEVEDIMFFLTDSSGKYSFQLAKTGCFEMYSEADNYLSFSTKSCFQYKPNKTINHTFYIRQEKDILMPPIIDTCLLKIMIIGENEQPISNAKVTVTNYFKPKEFIKDYFYEDNYLIVECLPNVTFEVTLTKNGYKKTKYIFDILEMNDGTAFYINPLTQKEYDEFIENMNKQIHKEMIIKMKKEN